MHLSFDRLLRGPLVLALALSVAATTSLSQAADWPYWRGPKFDGTAEASGLPDDWDPAGGEGSNLIWKREDIGGPCTPIVMGGKLYTVQRSDPGTPREGERVVCLDAKTGETIWENRYNVWLSDVPAERVGWSSVVGDKETGNVYVLGACDIFLCIDGQTGETLWKIPLHEQFGMLSTYGGRTNFPVIHEDLVIISGIIINWGERAKPNHRFIAMDKRTGTVVWFSGTTRPTRRHDILGAKPGDDRRSTAVDRRCRRRQHLGVPAANREATVALRALRTWHLRHPLGRRRSCVCQSQRRECRRIQQFDGRRRGAENQRHRR